MKSSYSSYLSEKEERIWILKENNKTDMYIIRSLNMTNYLCQNGFRILKVEDSEIDSRFKVFFFADTEELHNVMSMYQGV